MCGSFAHMAQTPSKVINLKSRAVCVLPGVGEHKALRLQVEGAGLATELRGSAGQAVQAAAWSPQGGPLVSCNRQGSVTFWKS